SASMLSLAVIALILPALFHALHPGSAARLSELRISESVGVILLLTYGLSLLFTLKTHRCLFWSESPPMEGPSWTVKKASLVLAGGTLGGAVECELLGH